MEESTQAARRPCSTPRGSHTPSVAARPIIWRTLTLAVLVSLALPAAALADTSVSISDSGYAPASVTVKRGDVVTWVNDGTQQHTVTSDDGTTMQSDVLGPGDSFATLFETAGTFTYRSTVAGDAMSGTVVVEAGPLPPTTGPTPPTGTVPEGFEPGPGITGTTTDAVTPQPDESDRPTALLVAGVAAAVVVAAALLAALRTDRVAACRRRPGSAPGAAHQRPYRRDGAEAPRRAPPGTPGCDARCSQANDASPTAMCGANAVTMSSSVISSSSSASARAT